MNLGCLVAIVFVHQLLSDATALPSVVKIGESFVYAFDDFRCFLSLQEAFKNNIEFFSEFIYYFFYRRIVCIENYVRKATESFEISWFFRFMNIGFINLVSKNYHADSSFSFLLTIVKILSSFLFQIAKIVERKWKLSIFAISCTMC